LRNHIFTNTEQKYMMLLLFERGMFKHAAHSPFFFSSKCCLFHNVTFFGSCIIHILHTECAKIQMPNSSALDVRPTCDTADVQAILPFPPNPLKHVLCDIPDCSSDYKAIPNVTFAVCNGHKCYELATLPSQVMV
jgi:hypothetical protein